MSISSLNIEPCDGTSKQDNGTYPVHVKAKPISAEDIVHRMRNPDSKIPRCKPEKVIIFTDVGRDIDDAALLVLMIYLHKIKVVEVLLIVANVKPTKNRARAAKFICENMGVPDMPVACGSNGTDQKREYKSHEKTKKPRGKILGAGAIIEQLQALKKERGKCNLVVVSSLRDLSGLIENNETLVEATVSSCVFQGGWKKAADGALETLAPDLEAINNSYDKEATKHVYNWLSRHSVQTYTATKVAAFEAAVHPDVFDKPARMGHPVAGYILRAFWKQEKDMFKRASQEDPKKRFMEHLDIHWYMGKHKRLSEVFSRGSAVPTKFKPIQQYLDMTLYDPVAGLICASLRYDLSEVYQPHRRQILVEEKAVDHFIIGRPADKAMEKMPDVNPELLRDVMVLLIREALVETMPNSERQGRMRGI